MEDAAHVARREHDARGARDARTLVQLEGLVEVVVADAQRFAQRHRVFHCHARALRQVLQRRVCGVAEQRRAAVAPHRDRLAVRGGPARPVLGEVDELARLRANAFEVTLHLLKAAFAHVPLFAVAAVKRDDDVVLLAAAQRVVQKVAVRADPDARRVSLQILRELRPIRDRAIHHMARDPRLVAHVLAPHRRLHALRADQRHAAVPAAFGVEHADSGVVLLDALHLRRRGHLNATRRLAPSRSELCTSARWITA